MTLNEINSVCQEEFGVGILCLCPTSALWLVEHILKTTGLNVYKQLANRRNKFGRGTAFPVYGSEVFNSM